jgi:hypothetical protein
LALPKKDSIGPWRLAMLGIGSVRPGSFARKVGLFALIIMNMINIVIEIKEVTI